jgi:thiamine biosynthesis protein ThiS
MNITVNGRPRAVGNGTTIASLLVDLELEPRAVAVELNRDIAPRERFGEQSLAEGDQLEIVTLVGGG